MKKKKREITVYRARGNRDNPLIMLQGNWLYDTGFSIGDRIFVTCKDGKLIIERNGRKWSDPKGDRMVAEETAKYMGAEETAEYMGEEV